MEHSLGKKENPWYTHVSSEDPDTTALSDTAQGYTTISPGVLRLEIYPPITPTLMHTCAKSCSSIDVACNDALHEKLAEYKLDPRPAAPS